MKDALHFEHLPAYAAFLLDHKAREFTTEQLRLLRELKVPMLKFYEGISDEQLIEGGVERTKKFLQHLKDNEVEQYIESSIAEWLANQIPLFSREKLLPEDITLISFMRRKLFRNFLPAYTTDITVSLRIMEEVDAFTVKFDTLCFKHLMELQQRLYEQAEALAHIGNWTWDLNTKNLVWSEEMFRIYELEHKDNANEYDIRKFTHPEDAAIVDEEMERTIRTLQPHDFYYRIILNSGKEKHVHAKGQPETNKEGVAVRMFGTLQDVTAQKIFETELKKSEERYHGMINEVQDYAIILLDKQGKILNWNKGAEKIKGYTAEEAVGKNFSIFYTEKDRSENLSGQLLQRAREEGRATHEGWRVRKDGTVFWGSVVITSLHDEAGQIFGFSKVTRDLTERKLAEEKLLRYAEKIERKNKMLEEANKELESFSYVASHDLQEPLRKIQAFTSRLLQKENDNLSEWGKDVFSKVQLSANRMQRLIEALLNFSRLDKTQEGFEQVDVNMMLDEIKNNLQEVAESKAVIIADPLPVMNVIPIQLQQLLSNLISNALKYSKPDVPPVVKISYGLKEGRAIPGNSALDLNKYHHITISDNGIGFEQQYAEKIFELFQRLHGKSEYEGTGIGLAICKKIVANHHGFINATGKPGEGAEFNIYLPSERKTELA
ncbi:MAG: sensor signal transduction histidine kinase [Bacteroidetes bacterium]|nr:sensor signal transduction histidine kinase [Bacteroidota bacterium]